MLWCADRNKELWECVSVWDADSESTLPWAAVEAPPVAPAEGPKGLTPVASVHGAKLVQPNISDQLHSDTPL